MQFTTSLLSFLAAAASVRALPNDKRQDTPRIYAKFFDDNACQGTWVEDTVETLKGTFSSNRWLQEPASTCIEVNIPFAFNSTLIADNLATRTLRVYSASGCDENSSNYFDVAPTIEQCYAQAVKSVKFL
ncbi:hypothetical protein G7054_g3047 [Neopestalotiopsis clavispora]|nr:hypothetical protein G7054_g3047 [Neopestalotiopsis clavispora]